MVSEIPGVRVLLGEGVSARVGGMGRERAARREGEVGEGEIALLLLRLD
jgi:hypothetical protein